jgi:hypothetical protein
LVANVGVAKKALIVFPMRLSVLCVFKQEILGSAFCVQKDQLGFVLILWSPQAHLASPGDRDLESGTIALTIDVIFAP